MRLNPEQLITFAVVVREGGIGAAAQRLHLTQPAVSNQLRKLQSAIGEPLYRRAGRGIVLTGVGQRLYGEAQRLADAHASAEALAEAMSAGEGGLVRIAASQTVGAYLLPAAVAAFRAVAPGVEIELESHNTQRVLERLGECDIGLVEGPQELPWPPHLLREVIGYDEIVTLLRQDDPLAHTPALSPQVLAERELICREAGSGTRALVEALFAEAGIVPHVHMALAGVAAVKEGVRQGLGIGFVSRLTLRHDSGPLCGVPLQPRLKRALTLITHRNGSPAAKRFIAFLHEHLAASSILAHARYTDTSGSDRA